MEHDCIIYSGKQWDGAEIDLTESDFYADGRNKMEIKVNGSWLEVSSSMFRSWTGERMVDGHEYTGPTFYIFSNDRYNGAGKESTHAGK